MRNPPFPARGALPFSVVAIIDQYEVVSGAVDEWAIMLRVEDSECVEE